MVLRPFCLEEAELPIGEVALPLLYIARSNRPCNAPQVQKTHEKSIIHAQNAGQRWLQLGYTPKSRESPSVNRSY